MNDADFLHAIGVEPANLPDAPQSEQPDPQTQDDYTEDQITASMRQDEDGQLVAVIPAFNYRALLAANQMLSASLKQARIERTRARLVAQASICMTTIVTVLLVLQTVVGWYAN